MRRRESSAQGNSYKQRLEKAPRLDKKIKDSHLPKDELETVFDNSDSNGNDDQSSDEESD